MSAWFWTFSFATSSCCQVASIFEKSNLSWSKATTPCCLQPQFGELRSQSNNRRSHRSVPELLLLPAITSLIHSLSTRSIVRVCSHLSVVLSDPIPIIALSCHSLSKYICWMLLKLLICLSCYMDFSEVLDFFVKIDTWISSNFYMDLSKLIYVFL